MNSPLPSPILSPYFLYDVPLLFSMTVSPISDVKCHVEGKGEVVGEISVKMFSSEMGRRRRHFEGFVLGLGQHEVFVLLLLLLFVVVDSNSCR